MTKTGLVISIIGGMIISLGAAYISLPDSPSILLSLPFGSIKTLGMFPEFANLAIPASLVLGILLYCTMLLGIALCHMFQTAMAHPNKPVRFNTLLQSLNKGSSWASFLASPIVFFSSASSLLELGFRPVAFFYALQNGFFCLTIFDGIKARFNKGNESPVEIP